IRVTRVRERDPDVDKERLPIPLSPIRRDSPTPTDECDILDLPRAHSLESKDPDSYLEIEHDRLGAQLGKGKAIYQIWTDQELGTRVIDIDWIFPTLKAKPLWKVPSSRLEIRTEKALGLQL
ncbi:Flavonoid 3',5'-hydroxylase 2, partial [Striga asiatica]